MKQAIKTALALMMILALLAAWGAAPAAAQPMDTVVTAQADWQTQAGDFLASDIVRTVLLIIGIAGILIEILTVGSFGIFGAAGTLSFALYFLGSFFTGSLGPLPLILLVGGMALLLLEIFVLPGFGVTGGLGIMAILVSLVMATPHPLQAIWSVLIALIVAGAIVYFTVKNKKTRQVWSKLVLFHKLDKEGGYDSADTTLSRFANKTGRALTTLRPAGSAEIEGEKVDVVTNGEFIEPGTLIEVMQIEGMRVVVRAK